MTPRSVIRKLERLWLSESPCWKLLLATFDSAGKFFPDSPAAGHATPAKIWALSGKERGCWKIGPAFGTPGFSSPSQTATAFSSSSDVRKTDGRVRGTGGLATGTAAVDCTTLF